MFHSVDMYRLKSISTDLQVFSPAQVIFAGVGVLLSVFSLFPIRHPIPTSFIGGQGC